MSTPPAPDSDICIPNINLQQRRRRLAFGIVAFALALALLVLLLLLQLSPWWRLLLLPVFWGATTGYFQWKDKT
jgi:fatty acid desaturase